MEKSYHTNTPNSAPVFTLPDAKRAGKSYQHIAHIVNLIVDRIVNTIDVERAAAFKPSVSQTIHALHGMLNGREISEKKPHFRAHIFTAPHFGFRDRSGEQVAAVREDATLTSSDRQKRIDDIRQPANESAARLVGRRLKDLAEAESACGRQFFVIRRADGDTQKLTSYEGHPLLDAAVNLYHAARNLPIYAEIPSAAITTELLDVAIASLPIVTRDASAKSKGESATMDAGDLMSDAVLKGMWTKWLTTATNNLTKEFDCGGDPELVAKKYALKIERIGKDIKQRLARERLNALSTLGDEDEEVPWRAAGEGDAEGDEEVGDGYNNGGQTEGGNFGDAAIIHPDKHVTPPPSQTVDYQQVTETPISETTESMLDWALYWAGTGIPVFPLHEVYDETCTCSCTRKTCVKGIHGCGSECKNKGKHPRTKNGVDDATCDPEQIKAWWGKYPTANIGGAMGRDLRLLAADVDPRNGGDASVHDLTEAHGEAWLNTKRNKTGSGGFHLFYTVPEGVTFRKGKLAPGIDLKYTGGYVVLPPSIHLSGRNYTIDNRVKPAVAPDWLIEELTRAPDVQPSKVVNFQERQHKSNSAAARFFGGGERNDGLRDVIYGRWLNGFAEDATDLYRQILEVRDTRCEFVPGDPPPTDAQLWDMVQRTTRKFPRGERVSA